MSSIESYSNPKSTENGDQALIAIVDGGIDIAHMAFRYTSGKTRILSIWDQTDGELINVQGLRIPSLSESPTFGRLHKEEEINNYLESGEIPINLQTSSPPSEREHGTRVASIAAGSNINDFRGIAPGANIIIVIVAIKGSPYFDIRYDSALQHIRYMSEYYEKPVVVNISRGLNSGGRDGKTLLEKNCDRFSNNSQTPGLIIVKSAGNARKIKSHAKLIVSTISSFLHWEAMNNPRRDHKIELWFNAENTMKFRLTNPSQETSRWFVPNDPEGYEFLTGNICQWRCKTRGEDNLLAITIRKFNSQIIEVGKWTLEIVGVSINRPEDYIHAWILHVEAETRYDRIKFLNHIDEQTTLTIPGTAKTIITVSSVSRLNSLSASDFSSLGRTRDGREQPVLAAPGENIRAATAGTSNSIEIVREGTSYAAAHVTGAIALLLSARKKQCELNPSLSQFNAGDIKRILIEMTNGSTEDWRFDIGHGVLDMQRLLDNLDELATR